MSPRTILLSKHFSENCELVAGMCRKCYAEQDDCRIVAVNRKFLTKTGRVFRNSPHNLIEESLWENPWALLVATIFLNKTSCYQARPYLLQFLQDFKHPAEVLEVSPGELERYFVKIGLRKRALQVWKMSRDFLFKDWKQVKELYGIGQYGQDAFRLFCLGDLGVEPKDRFLRIYKAWFLTHKQTNTQDLDRFRKF